MRGLLTVIVFSLTTTLAAANQDNQDLELLAQWSLNHGSYLLDVGKYLEALEAFDTTVESSRIEATQTRGLMFRALTLATFLDASDQALKVYQQIQQDYPASAENAAYRQGLLLFDMERHADAVKTLEAYLAKYPQGRFRFQAEAVLEQARTAAKPVAPAAPLPAVKSPEPKKLPAVKPAQKPPEKPQPLKPSQQLPKPPQPPVLPEKAPPTPQPIVVDKPKPPATKPVVKPTLIEQPVVRVLLFRSAPRVELSGGQLRMTLEDREYAAGDTLQLSIQDGKVKPQGWKQSATQIQIHADGPIRIKVKDKTKTVRGTVVAGVKGDRVEVVNRVDIESYLRGVVPSESYPTWPEQTLRAQAVAARTYVLYQIQHRQQRPYDVVDNEGDQAYKGVDREHPKTDRAVAATSGQILTIPGSGRSESKPILAMYSANSGGHTADAKAIFRVDNTVLKAQPDPWSLEGQMATWTRRFSREELEQGLAKIGVKVNNLRAIEAVQIGPSGRLIRVQLIHDGQPIKIRSRPVLTRALKLPEILIDIQPQGDNFVFNGKGWGHGVGYSQWGGAGMGKKGKEYRTILAYYYPGTEIQQLW